MAVDKKKSSYSADSIKVLKGLDAVKKRPGMYIGDTEDGSGLHHMIYEVLDNSVDESLAGYCNQIWITVNQDGSVTVEDNGRGIPVDFHEQEGMSAAKVIMTQLHAGGKFDQNSYKVSGGLHGVGISVVNALSSKLILRIFRNGNEYELTFHEGISDQDISLVREIEDKSKSGTQITFWPSSKIFGSTDFDLKTIKKRLQEVAFLNSTLKITLNDLRVNPTFHTDMFYEGGLSSFVQFLDKANKSIIEKPIHYYAQKKDGQIDFSLQW